MHSVGLFFIGSQHYELGFELGPFRTETALFTGERKHSLFSLNLAKTLIPDLIGT